jgi:serine phosphatase RsbU (regulator of sigma subunit)/CHASE3 domain sensor protein
MLKRTPFENKVIGLLLLVLLFVASSAVLVYLNLRIIINDITEEARPDETLIILKEMMYDISDAENSVKSYGLTKNPDYLDLFDKKTTEVDSKIQQLRELTQENEKHSDYVDSLDYLTKNQFVLLEDLLILENQIRMDLVIEKVIENVENAGEKQAYSEENEEKKQGFFKRLRDKRKDKKQEKNGEEEFEVDLSQLGQELNQIKIEENLKEQELREQEYELIKEDKQIMDRITAIFELMEEEEASSMQAKLEEADKSSNKTKYLVAGFCLLVFVLLAFAAYTIFTYVRRNNAYKKALKAAKDETEHKNKEITDSIHYAQRIQNAILPDDGRFTDCLPKSFVIYEPKDIVAGDFYWMVKQGNTILLAAADCTGHGVPGAMVSVVCHNALNRSVREFGLIEPAKILEKTRELVIETLEEGEVSDGMDIALCSIDTLTKEVQYAGANNSLYIVKNKVLQEIKADKQPVGRFSNYRPFTNHIVDIAEGDRIFLFTDGLADQFGGPKGKKFKYKPFKSLLERTSQNTLNIQKEEVMTSFEIWKGSLEQVDDVCIIGVEF